MQMILNKGHRIRASDKYLVYRFCAGTLLSLFLLVLILLNMGQLMRTDALWKRREETVFSEAYQGTGLCGRGNKRHIGVLHSPCAKGTRLFTKHWRVTEKKNDQ